MSYLLQAWIQCDSVNQAKVLESLLARETRPLFSGDIAEEHRAMFDILEDVDYPTRIESDSSDLWVLWSEIEGIGFTELITILNRLGVSAPLVFEVVDYPLSADTEVNEVSGWFWVLERNEYRKVRRAKVLKNFSKDITSRFPDWAGKP